MSISKELKRRNIFRVAIAYLALAWLLIEVSGTLFPAFGIPDWVFRFVVISLVIAFVPTLIFSWVYEITPEGLKRETEVKRDESAVRFTARRLDWLTIGLIVVALGFIAIDRLLLSSGPAPQPAPSIEMPGNATATVESESIDQPDSIAVLPFANRSANPDDVFFVDGIHDDLLTYIAQIGSIKTISRTSVMQYRDTTKPIRQIASELEVDTVLEGGVQRAGEQVRINVQLIDARTDDHLWSEIYDRKLTASNIFTIQSEIAEAITEALRATLTSEARERIESVPTHSLSALEAYFQGRQLLEKRTAEALVKADDYFEKAVAEDPDFALAYVGLADTYRLQANYAGYSHEEMDALGQAAVTKALQLKPLLGEAHTSQANLKHRAGDYEGAEASFKRALELNPNYAPAYQWYGEMLGLMGNRTEDALELSSKAVSLDPLSPIIHNDYGEVLYSAGLFDEAREQYLKAIEIDPGFSVAQRQLAELYWTGYGRLDKAYFHYYKSLKAEPERSTDMLLLAMISAELGDFQRALDWMKRAQKITKGGDSSGLDNLVNGYIHEYLGQDSLALDYALKWLDAVPRSAYGFVLMVNLEMKAGNYRAVHDSYDRSFPELQTNADPEVDRRNYRAAIRLAAILLKTGEHDRAKKILDRSLSVMGTLPRMGTIGFGVDDAWVFALIGDQKKALESLQKAADLGWTGTWRHYFKHDLVFQPLHEEPEFQLIREKIKASVAGQLAQVNEWEANGDLAPIQ